MGTTPATEFVVIDRQPTANNWIVQHSRGSARTFHHIPLPDQLARPEIWIHRVDRTTLVLGSTQDGDLVDIRRLGDDIDLAKRRSGGGLVLLSPTSDLWVDFLIPAHHRLWDHDVGRSFLWVGELWKQVLDRVLSAPTTVIDRPRRIHRKPLICFADLSTGEVTSPLGAKPAKVVGLSQRRNRSTARIQSLFMAHWKPEWTSMLPRVLNYDRIAEGGYDGPLSTPQSSAPHAGLALSEPAPDPAHLVALLLAAIPQDFN